MSVCIYAGFADEWEATTGVPQATVLALAERLRDGIATHLEKQMEPTVVREPSQIEKGAVVLFACALGTERAETFAGASACSAAPELWDWVSPKHVRPT
jgi:hypothetical protein